MKTYGHDLEQIFRGTDYDKRLDLQHKPANLVP